MSPSLEKQYLSGRVDPEMRELHFKATGEYSDDFTIYSWYHSLGSIPQHTHNTDGSKTSFYNIPDWVKDVDDLAEYWDLRGDEFNCLKALAGIALGSRHSGTNPMRDANKLVHYANRIKSKLEKATNK